MVDTDQDSKHFKSDVSNEIADVWMNKVEGDGGAINSALDEVFASGKFSDSDIDTYQQALNMVYDNIIKKGKEPTIFEFFNAVDKALSFLATQQS